MAKRIHTILLQEKEFVQVDRTDDFVEVVKSSKRYPVYLTNYALSKGHDMGILKSTLVSDLLNIKGVSDDDKAQTFIEGLDEQKMLNIIYLAFKGANPKSEITKDEFMSLYHGDFEERMKLYVAIIESAVKSDPNSFAKGLEESTEKTGTREKK